MLNRDNEHVDLNSINEVDQRVNVTAKLVDLWESQNNDITQVGLLGDKTGSIKSTKWASSVTKLAVSNPPNGPNPTFPNSLKDT